MPHPITVPRLGWSMEQGTFLGWKKKDGDFVRAGEVLFELEGEKAAQEIESLDSGILRIPANAPKEGTVVLVGSLLAYLLAEGEPIPPEGGGEGVSPAASLSDPHPNPLPKGEGTAAKRLVPVASPAARRLARELGVNVSSVTAGNGGRVTAADIRSLGQSAAPASTSRIISSPRARRVAKELGINWKSLAGSGKSGRIRECDVRAAAGHSQPESAGTRIPISSRRRTIAARMAASCQQTAPVTLTTRADATNLVNLRAQFKTAGGDVVPSYADILVKLAAAALQQHPIMAARWEETHLALPNGIHIGIAVDTEEGLIVPVLRDVPSLSLLQLAARARELIESARNNKLKADDLQGGVFTITNLGAFGIDAFTPIINLPETAILGIGCIRREPAVVDNQIVPRDQITLSLTFDHRIVDGAPAARFLQAIRLAVENPSAWLLQK
jgi:pyruvate dehydrogenase E2 component (dihydrolipoamide acetyltransferase)